MGKSHLKNLLPNDDPGAVRNHLIQLADLGARHVHASVGAVVFVDGTAECGTPGGVVQSVGLSDERHPVTHVAYISRTGEIYIPSFVMQFESSFRSSASSAAGDHIAL